MHCMDKVQYLASSCSHLCTRINYVKIRMKNRNGRNSLSLTSKRLYLAQMQELSLSDRRYHPNRLQNGRRHFPVDANKGDSVCAALRFPAPEGKRSDIDSEFPQRCPNLADDS